MKSKISIALSCGYWTAYFMIILMILCIVNLIGLSNIDLVMVMQLICAFALIPSLISYAFIYFLVHPKYVEKKAYSKAKLYSIIVIIGSAGIGLMIVSIIEPGPRFFSFQDDYLSGLLIIVIISTFSGLISILSREFSNYYELIETKNMLLLENRNMELKLIKTQFDPHFLFNTLNNIDGLISSSKSKASKLLNNLSEIMRFVLFQANKEKIPLQQEIEIIKKYVDLQKIRSSNEAYVTLIINGKPEGWSIAPLILISIIENAFKHVSCTKLTNSIFIEININRNCLTLLCGNRFKDDAKINANGKGNMLLSKRLKLIYPNSYGMTRKMENGYYKVELKLKNEKG